MPAVAGIFLFLMSKKESGSNPLKAKLIMALLWVFAKIPFWLSKPIMRFFAFFARLLNSRSYHVSLVNIAKCLPSLDLSEQKKLAKKSLIHTFELAPEIAKSWMGDDVSYMIGRVYGEELARQAQESGKGVFITGSHIGNWEVGLFYLGKTFDFTCMYRQPRHKELDSILVSGRGKNNTTMVPGNAAGLKSVMKALKQQEVVTLLADQEPGDKGLFVPFFGEPAKTMDLIQKIQKRTDAEVFEVAAIKNGSLYDIYFKPFEMDVNLSPVEYATLLNKKLEETIRQNPEQYQWSYKRFKSTPDGSPNPYNK